MATSKWKAKWLYWNNKILSGLLALMGFASCSDEDEVDAIVPMYGMPSSIYKIMDKTDAMTVETSVPEENVYLLNTEKRKKHAI